MELVENQTGFIALISFGQNFWRVFKLTKCVNSIKISPRNDQIQQCWRKYFSSITHTHTHARTHTHKHTHSHTHVHDHSSYSLSPTRRTFRGVHKPLLNWQVLGEMVEAFRGLYSANITLQQLRGRPYMTLQSGGRGSRIL